MEKKLGFFKKLGAEFKAFALRGSVIDLAVGVIIGGALQTIINSLVKDIIMPVISVIAGGIDYSNMFILLGKLPEGVEAPTTLEAARNIGAVLAYGSFVTAIINFFIMAAAIFALIKLLNSMSMIRSDRMKKAKKEAVGPTTKKCPYCFSEVNIKATRCSYCTSELN